MNAVWQTIARSHGWKRTIACGYLNSSPGSLIAPATQMLAV